MFNAEMSETAEEPGYGEPDPAIGDDAIDDAVWETVTSDFTADDW